jgi:hypothetical protein
MKMGQTPHCVKCKIPLLATMDWITFIKWNGIVYATYYWANCLVDYLAALIIDKFLGHHFW